MAVAGWLATNAGRAFPLQDPVPTMTRASDRTQVALPDEAIVDLAVVVLPAGVLAPGTPPWLAGVSRDVGGTFTFTVAGATPALAFAGVDPAAAPFADYRAATTAAGPCGRVAAWSGTLTVGDLTRLAALLAPGDSLAGSCPLEPAAAVDLAALGVATLSLANVDRIRVPPYLGAPVPPALRPVYVAARCLSGPLEIARSYNLQVRQDPRTNTLTLSASPGAGAGQPCGEVPLFPGEVPPPHAIFLDGSPACDGLVSAVNGLAGPAVEFAPGGGFSVAPDPTRPATLVVAYRPGAAGGCPEYLDSSRGASESADSSAGSEGPP